MKNNLLKHDTAGYIRPAMDIYDLSTEAALCVSGENGDTYSEVNFNWGSEE